MIRQSLRYEAVLFVGGYVASFGGLYGVAISAILLMSGKATAELTESQFGQFAASEMLELDQLEADVKAIQETINSDKIPAEAGARAAGDFAMAEQYQDQIDDLLRQAKEKEMVIDNKMKSLRQGAVKYGKSLEDIVRPFRTVPLPGYLDLSISVMLFWDSVQHDGVPFALADVGFDLMPDIHQIVGIALAGGMIGATGAMIRINEIHEEVEEWKAWVRNAMKVANHTEERACKSGYNGAISSMQAALDSINDTQDQYVGKARAGTAVHDSSGFADAGSISRERRLEPGRSGRCQRRSAHPR